MTDLQYSFFLQMLALDHVFSLYGGFAVVLEFSAQTVTLYISLLLGMVYLILLFSWVFTPSVLPNVVS